MTKYLSFSFGLISCHMTPSFQSHLCCHARFQSSSWLSNIPLCQYSMSSPPVVDRCDCSQMLALICRGKKKLCTELLDWCFKFVICWKSLGSAYIRYKWDLLFRDPLPISFDFFYVISRTCQISRMIRALLLVPGAWLSGVGEQNTCLLASSMAPAASSSF